MSQTAESTVLGEPDADEFRAYEDLWAVIAWNDDVTTFETVIKAFVEIFGHSPARAERLAWQIHRTGKAVVAVRPKTEAEDGVRRLHQRKIQASLDRA